MAAPFSFEEAQPQAQADAPQPGLAAWLAEHPGATPAQMPKAAQAAAPATFSFDEAKQPPAIKDTRTTGLIANVGAGTSETTAGLLGLPVDIVTGALNLGTGALRAIGVKAPPPIQNPFGGSDTFKSLFGFAGADPRTIAPADTTEQVARATGAGAASMLLPWSLARGIAPMAGIPGAVQRGIGAGGAPTQIAAGAGAGAGGQIAENLVPEPYKPLASFGGQMLGGGAVLAPLAGARAVVDAGANRVRGFVQPFTEAGQRQIAGQRILGAATDPTELTYRMADPAGLPPPLVPGSEPTTFQLTNDQGLGNLERAVAKNNPELWMGRLGQQNAARVQGLSEMAPETASADAVSAHFRGQLHDIDTAHAAQIDAARTAARDAVNTLGGTGELQTYGQRLRAGLAALNDATRRQVSGLYTAVDPDGTLAVPMSGIRQRAADIVADRPANAAPLAGDIKGIFDTATTLPDMQLFPEAGALRSRITDAMREELYNKGRSQDYRTLTQLLAAVDNTLSGSVAARAASEAGARAPEQTVLGRMQANLEQQRNAWQQRQAQSGGGAAANIPGQQDPAGGVGGLPGAGGDQRQGAPGSGYAPGDRGVAAEAAAAVTPFDEAAAARYRLANAAHAERVATYEEAPGVGQVLGTGRRAGEWRLGDSQVPATIFNSGKGAIERVQAFLRAGGSNEALVADLRDYAAFDLRRAAEAADGTLDPARTQRWLAAHDQALAGFPELRGQFQNAATARQMVDDAVARHVAARQAIEDSAARRFLGDADPVASMGRILRSDTAAAELRDLAARTALNPAARAGLQRATVDFIMQELRSNTIIGEERTLQPDKFTRFVQKSSPALRHIFSPEQVEAINAVATDLQRSQRSVSGTKLPGGSNTAQDLAAGNKHGGGHPSTAAMLAGMEAGGEALHEVGAQLVGPVTGVFGRIAGIVLTPVLSAMRETGLKHAGDLVTEAMLHPELARTLLAELPRSAGAARSYGAMLRRQIYTLALESSLRSQQREPAASMATSRAMMPQRGYGLATPPSPVVRPQGLRP